MYAAEDFVRTLFDRAAEHNSRAIDFFGAQLTLPPEARFGSVQSVGDYVDRVLSLPAVGDRWPVSAVTVRARRGATAAHYENRDGTAVIAIPSACPGGRFGNWWCSTRSPIICVRSNRHTEGSSYRRSVSSPRR